MSEVTRASLIHSGIDPEDPDFLAHYGVAGMQWGQRKIETKSTTVNSRGNILSERKRLKNKIHNAYAKKLSKDSTARRDDRSKKTVNLGKAAAGSLLGSIGTAAVSGLSKNPKVRVGAGLVSNILGVSTVVLAVNERKSAKQDLLKTYG